MYRHQGWVTWIYIEFCIASLFYVLLCECDKKKSKRGYNRHGTSLPVYSTEVWHSPLPHLKNRRKWIFLKIFTAPASEIQLFIIHHIFYVPFGQVFITLSLIVTKMSSKFQQLPYVDPVRVIFISMLVKVLLPYGAVSLHANSSEHTNIPKMPSDKRQVHKNKTSIKSILNMSWQLTTNETSDKMTELWAT